MGRVARYKKIKACDPFGKGGIKKKNGMCDVWGLGNNGQKRKKRSRTSELLHQERLSKRRKRKEKNNSIGNNEDGKEDFFNIPCEEEDDFDLNDLMNIKPSKEENLSLNQHSLQKKNQQQQSLEKDNNKKNNKKKKEEERDETTKNGLQQCAIPTTNAQALREASADARSIKGLKINVENNNKNQDDNTVKRLEGESKRAFQRRLKRETRALIKQQKDSAHLRPNKKLFLTEKKNKKKNIRDDNNQDYDDDDDDIDAIVRRKHAMKRAMNNKVNNNDDDGGETIVAFGEQVERPPIFRHLPRGAKPKPKNLTSTATKQEAMEQLRLQVQAKYQLLKQQRRQAGQQFHL